MSKSPNTPLFVAMVVCVLLVAGVMTVAVFLAGQKPIVVVLPQTSAPVVQGLPAAPMTPVASGSLAAPATPAPAPPQVVVARVAAVPALDDVFSSVWEAVPVVPVPLQPQQTAAPMLEHATIESISVQAARDDRRIAWRLSWPAARPSSSVDTGQFADAVAIQLPMVDGAPFTMGAKDMPVRLLHWRALWQRDIDKGFQDVQDLYPNAWADLYWFTNGLRIDKSYVTGPARQFMPALAAGNPMIQLDRRSPVEELVAEGFGTATHVPDSPSNGRGVWKDGRWTVVLDRPLDKADRLVARLLSSDTNLIAFAVWDGAAGNRGGQKHYCTWIPLRIEP